MILEEGHRRVFGSPGHQQTEIGRLKKFTVRSKNK